MKKVAKKAEKKPRVKKEPAYVAASYKIEYTMPYGLVGMLAYVSKKSEKEVWCVLTEVCNICALRLSKRASQQSSWTEETFPGTKVGLSIEMKRPYRRYNYTTQQYIEPAKDKLFCTIELNFSQKETFTQEQVNDYITEKIILGDDDGDDNSEPVEVNDSHDVH